MPTTDDEAADAVEAEAGVGPYTLCPLLTDVVLSEEGTDPDVRITCVEFWNDNLYIGTSAAELLHYVLLPPEPDAPAAPPSFIYASRRQPDFDQGTANSNGVEQILVLPSAGKACVLCNGTLTFYSLPELSPAYGGSLKVAKCAWVGGVDQSADAQDEADGVVVMICLEDKVRLVRIGEKPKTVRSIQLGNCLAVARQGSIACAADARSYSLLEVVEQQRIPLFEISSQVGESDNEAEAEEKPLPSLPQAVPGQDDQTRDATSPERASNLTKPELEVEGDGNSTHLKKSPEQSEERNDLPPRTSSLMPAEPDAPAADNKIRPVEETVPSRTSSIPPKDPKRSKKAVGERLRPNIATPTPSEFLLTTGTSKDEAGVGIFVNLDGDVVRGTLQFSQYPESLVVDGQGIDAAEPATPGIPQEEGYVLAVVTRNYKGRTNKVVEIQRWDLDPSESRPSEWLHVNSVSAGSKPAVVHDIGLRSALSPYDMSLPPVIEKLRLTRNRLGLSAKEAAASPSAEDTATARERSEAAFVAQISRITSKLILWSGNSIWWTVRCPLVIQLDSRLHRAIEAASQSKHSFIDRTIVEGVISRLRGQEASNELDFLGIKYIRQKASLLLFADMVSQILHGVGIFERDIRVTEETLVEGEIDPRVILARVPVLQDEIVQGSDGMWLQGGLDEALKHHAKAQKLPDSVDPRSPLATVILQLTKRYLFHWRRKKGFGSIADEQHVFKTVDAALLRALLILDSTSPAGRAADGSIRSELNLVVDRGVDCTDRAVTLLKDFKRLYVLSRLYQQQRQYSKVLETWKAIVEGEEDAGGELGNGEEVIRDYLSKRKDPNLVEEYGTWLAIRNPKLGVQVFADPKSHVKFQPKAVVEILKKRSPNAVRDFLEYLVFGNNDPQYANDLIGYYLDSVLAELESSEASRRTLAASYTQYRSLGSPKPAYSHFAADNGPKADWWRARLRLLQLLGGSHGAASQYDVEKISERIEQHKGLLVPETIILSGRQGRHTEALGLLTHGLGDFDTAVSYCMLGGAGTYSAVTGRTALPSRQEQAELFAHLLEEFLHIEDVGVRITQASELLGRFAPWFEINHVLSLLPDSWSVDLVAAFLESSLRRLVGERRECAVGRALVSSENLAMNAKIIEKLDTLRPKVETVQEVD